MGGRWKEGGGDDEELERKKHESEREEKSNEKEGESKGDVFSEDKDESSRWKTKKN